MNPYEYKPNDDDQNSVPESPTKIVLDVIGAYLSIYCIYVTLGVPVMVCHYFKTQEYYLHVLFGYIAIVWPCAIYKLYMFFKE